MRLLQGDGHDGQLSVALRVVEEGALPFLEHPPGQVGGYEDLFGTAQAAHVDEDDLALEQFVEDPPADETAGSVEMQGRSTMRRARRCTTWRVFRATRADSSTSRKPGRSSTRAKSTSQESPSRLSDLRRVT